MNWTLIQVIIDLSMGVALFVMWMRLKRPPQDDPRLSRGLQLLQSKINVLEDLSDRTDVQVRQLSHLLDHKTRVIQDKLVEADRHNSQIHESMQKSLEVAEIFQDRIPHEDILERQKTINYVKAAKMAHQGHTVEEICAQVDLPREQIELIAKFNREELMFNEDALPEWAKAEASAPALNRAAMVEEALPPRDTQALENLGKKFKEACVEFDEREKEFEKEHPAKTFLKAEAHRTAEVLKDVADGIGKKLAHSASNFLENRAENRAEERSTFFTLKETTDPSASKTEFKLDESKPSSKDVKKVQFPRI